MRFMLGASVLSATLLCGCNAALHNMAESMPVLGERCESFQCMSGSNATREQQAKEIIAKEQIRLAQERAAKQAAQPLAPVTPLPAAPVPPAPAKSSTWDYLFGQPQEDIPAEHP